MKFFQIIIVIWRASELSGIYFNLTAVHCEASPKIGNLTMNLKRDHSMNGTFHGITTIKDMQVLSIQIKRNHVANRVTNACRGMSHGTTHGFFTVLLKPEFIRLTSFRLLYPFTYTCPS